MTDARAAHILLVEDNPLDARATLRAIDGWHVPSHVQVLTDGSAAIEHLNDAANRRPDLVLLDVNLPGSDGHEVLASVKAHSELRRIPVIMLTTSAAERDVVSAYDLGANAYIVKPVTLDDWSGALEQIEQFWFSLAELPPM